ncbi:MAG TPA: hypothetical protein PKN31_06170 [Candidatus Atribacteria bacterium]|nr:hypothetical protein [Atribacterota bacterium]HOA99543.1 hypothetical protein [Candidatus Atribacteria bacterium]
MRMKKSILWENFPLLLEERKERKNSAIPKIFIGNPSRPHSRDFLSGIHLSRHA